MVIVWTRSHLGDDLRTLVYAYRSIVDRVAEVLHATNTIDYIVSVMNAASQSICHSLAGHRTSSDLDRVMVWRGLISLNHLSAGSLTYSLWHRFGLLG